MYFETHFKHYSCTDGLLFGGMVCNLSFNLSSIHQETCNPLFLTISSIMPIWLQCQGPFVIFSDTKNYLLSHLVPVEKRSYCAGRAPWKMTRVGVSEVVKDQWNDLFARFENVEKLLPRPVLQMRRN